MINTKRLTFYRASEKDINTIISIEEDKENRDYVWTGTYEEHLNEINDPGHLLLLINKKDTDKLVGYALIAFDFKSNIFELRRIVITKKGRGYGKEAMEAIISYAFERTDTNRFWLDVYPDNIIGIKLYEGLGLHKEGVLRQNYKSERGYLDQIIYSILRQEYKEWKIKRGNSIEWE